jgi:sugar/nucleoside kinase (ribokinase family)
VQDCIVETSYPTGVTVVLNRGVDRAMLSTLGTTGRMTADLVPRRLVHSARHVHSGSLFLQSKLLLGQPGLFAEARESGATTSFDTNWDPSKRWESIGPVLREADIFFLNEQELAHIAGMPEEEDAVVAASVLGSDGLIVVKRGSRGAIAYLNRGLLSSRGGE